MAYVLTDEQLDRICERSEGLCGCDCIRCEAFAANWRYNNGYDDEDEEQPFTLNTARREQLRNLFNKLQNNYEKDYFFGGCPDDGRHWCKCTE